MFQPNIWLANFLLAEYPDEYPAGWYLVKTHILWIEISRISCSYDVILDVSCDVYPMNSLSMLLQYYDNYSEDNSVMKCLLLVFSCVWIDRFNRNMTNSEFLLEPCFPIVTLATQSRI